MVYFNFWSKAVDDWQSQNAHQSLDREHSVSHRIAEVNDFEKTKLEEFSKSDAQLLSKSSILLEDFLPLVSRSINQTIVEYGKATNEKYNYITDYGTQILAIFTPSNGCSYLSRNFERLTGNNPENLMGDAFFSLVHADFEPRLRDVMPQSVIAGKPQVFRCKMQHGDGKYYWYQFTIHAENNNQTNTAEYVCIVENIHENMQVQSVLQKAKLETELAFRARSEFLANMSHELRTPLNAVIGFSQMMESGIFGKIENEHYQNYVGLIQDSGYELLAKIEDLLEISNIDAGRVSLNREEIYADDLIKFVVQTQSHNARAANINLSYIPKGNPLLFVDRLKLQHIFGHLIANAIKFNRSGGEVNIFVERAENSGIKISIKDTGHGMDDLKCHDIREALSQESCWTAKNSHHIGIGLALTKEFVALHDGTVEIQSGIGFGTTISIILPRDAIRITPTRKSENRKAVEAA